MDDLSEDDIALIEAARAAMEACIRRDWRVVGAALRLRSARS